MGENEEFVQEFLVECDENLDQLDQDLIALEQNPRDPQRLASIFRSIHTIKGTSGFFGFSRLGAIAHVGENLLSRLRDGELILDAETATVLLDLMDAIREILRSIEKEMSEGGGDYRELCVRISDLAERPSQEVPLAATGGLSEDRPSAAPAADFEPAPHSPPPAEEGAAVAADPAADSTIGIDVPPESLAEESTTIALAAEERGGESNCETPTAGSLEIQTDIADNQQPEENTAVALPSEERPASEPRTAAAEGSIRVDVGLLDKLMNLVGELVLARNQIRPFGEGTSDRIFANATQQLDLITSELQEGVMQTRMQPIRNILLRFPRVVRDLAMASGKQAKLEMQGQDTELDRTLIEAIKDPLTHLVRNAVDHGIELPEIRTANGKPACGQIVLRAFHEGGLVNIELSDDGAGIDPERIRVKALERDLISRDQARAMNDQQLIQLIFLPGLSTAQKVTDVSGRGVGMDVVKTNIDKIGGTMDIESRLGQGTLLRIKIPLTLAIIPALMVCSGGQQFAIPQVSLREILTFTKETRRRIDRIQETAVYRLRGELLPLVELNRVLNLDGCTWDTVDRQFNVLVLQAEGQRFGLVVDSVLTAEEIVVKPLHKALSRLPVFSGATILGSGRISMILDVAGLGQNVGVVNTDHAITTETEDTSNADNPFSEYLACELAGGRRVAVPLLDIERLEEFPLSSVETTCDRPVLRYRGQVMPLLQLEPERLSTSIANGLMQIVVHRAGNKHVGLVVQRILDISPAEQALDVSQRRAGICGCTVIQQRVTDVVDIRDLARAAGVPMDSSFAVEAAP